MKFKSSRVKTFFQLFLFLVLFFLVAVSILIFMSLYTKKNQEGLSFVFDHDTISNGIPGFGDGTSNSSGTGTGTGNGDQSLTAKIKQAGDKDKDNDSLNDYLLDKNQLPNKDIFYNLRWLFEYRI
jgi:hypothetical protein